MFLLITVPGGDDEAAEDVNEWDEGGGSGETLNGIGGMVAAAHQQQTAHSCDTCNTTYMVCLTMDPDPSDPYVLRPPGFGSAVQRYGSGSFYHQAKIVRKNLDSYCFVTFFWLPDSDPLVRGMDPQHCLTPGEVHGSQSWVLTMSFIQPSSTNLIYRKISVGDPWHLGADPDPHLWLTDLDPTSDPTPLSNDFKDAKKNFFPHIFSYNLPAGTLFSDLKI